MDISKQFANLFRLSQTNEATIESLNKTLLPDLSFFKGHIQVCPTPLKPMTILNDTLKELILDLKERLWSLTDIQNTIRINKSTCKSFYYCHMEIQGLPPKIIVKKSSISANISIAIKKTLLAKPKISIRKLVGYLFIEYDIEIPRSTLHLYGQVGIQFKGLSQENIFVICS